MLTLVTGNSGTGKTTYVTECIRRDIADGHRVYLIVPEQQTVSAERDMASLLPKSAPLLFEVVNFTRLADTVFRMHGGLAAVTCDASYEQLLMWRTLTELAPLLHTRIEAEPKNITKMRSIVNELRGMRMTPATLNEAAGKIDGDLQEKLHDYALISATYHALLTEYAGDTSDCLDRLAETLTAHPFPENTKIYIDNFSSFTEQEYGVVEALLRHLSVTVTLCVPPHTALQLSASEVEGTRIALTKIATQCGVEIQTKNLTFSHRLGNGARAYVAEHLFRADYATVPSYTGETRDLSLVECPDPLDACDFIASDIRRRVMDENACYQDFAVVCGSALNYAGLIDASFEKYDVPFFFSRRQDMLSLEPIKMILSAYAVISGGWRREDVIAYLKCAPLATTADVRDELELYSETWNIHGARWHDDIPWNMNPFGYGAPHTEEQRTYAAAKLARVNEARAHLTPPLVTLSEMNRERHPISAHIRALTQFLLTLDLPNRLDARAEEYQHTDRVSAAEYTRLWDVICDILDAMNHILGDMTVTLDEFAAQLRMVFSGVKLGAIPASLDEVTVGEARMLRAGEVKHVYLLGANEGEFPPPPPTELSFTENERQTLTDIGISFSEDADARAARELFAFWRALNMAKEHVTVLWSRSGISLDTVVPSDPVLRIRRLLGDDYPIFQPSALDLARSVSTPAAAGERLGQAHGTSHGIAIRQVLGDNERYIGDVAALQEPLCNNSRSLSPALAAGLWHGDLAMTQSRVQKLKECPFSYFCTHVLKLDETRRAEFDARATGDFIHAVLEKFFSLVKTRGIDPHNIDPAMQESLLAEVEETVKHDTLPSNEADLPRVRALLTSLGRYTKTAIAALCEEFSHSRFAPAFFELSIDKRNDDTPTPVVFPLGDETNIFIYGSIDRVDTYTEGDTVYIRVVDYKTGTKKFSLKDIEEGINLQLLLYLFAILESDSPKFRNALGISENGNILPAAVLYLSSLTANAGTDQPRTAEEAHMLIQKNAGRSGLIIDDLDIIHAMDDTAKKDYLPISINKDGSLSKGSRRSLTDVATLGKLKRQIGDTLSELGTALKRGEVPALPMKKGNKGSEICDRCRYKSICRYTTIKKDGAEKKSSDSDDGDD